MVEKGDGVVGGVGETVSGCEVGKVDGTKGRERDLRVNGRVANLADEIHDMRGDDVRRLSRGVTGRARGAGRAMGQGGIP